jgi:hypothetical protein
MMLARENYDGPHVRQDQRTFPQAAQNGQTSHPPKPE